MDDDRKRQIATFRFGVIHNLVGHVELEPGEQERLITGKALPKVGDSLFRKDEYLTKHAFALD